MAVQPLRIKYPWLLALGLGLLLVLGRPLAAPAADADKEERKVQAMRAEALWNQAETARKSGDLARAANLHGLLYDRYSQALQAKDSLWLAASLYKELALQVKGGDNWENARQRYKQYTIEFPRSDHYEEAYFEVSICLYHQNRFREAMTQLKVFEGRFPSSRLLSRVRYQMALAMLKLDKIDEAAHILAGLVDSPDPVIGLKARTGEADILFARKQYQEARAAYKKILAAYPDYYRENPEILISLGLAGFKMKDEEEGRAHLYRYLNLIDAPGPRPGILFELGESYGRQGDDPTAQKLYRQALDTAGADDRTVTLGRFRRAQYRDDPSKPVLDKFGPKGDPADPAQDREYLAVLESFKREPMAQEARHGLFRRYVARKDQDRAYEIGREFLANQAGPEATSSPAAEEILVFLADTLLTAKRYQEVYELYRSEYRHVQAGKQGRLLYLVGQALEELRLYEQAASVYYRALALRLSDEEKTGVYTRRAKVYMAAKDYAAADRLLRHLRKVYAGGRDMGEIYFLSGRLAERQEKKTEALTYYGQADEVLAPEQRRDEHGEARLRLLFELGRHDEVAGLLDRYRLESALSAPVVQQWYLRLGDYRLSNQEASEAQAAYLKALGEGLPTEGADVQRLHLRLSDLFMSQGDREKAQAHLEAARAGKDGLWSRIAEERQGQQAIDSGLSQYKSLLGPAK